MHPVGPRSQGVYWLRRTFAAALAVVVVVGVVWWVVGRGSGKGSADPAADTVTTTSPQLTGVLATDTTTKDPAATSDSTAASSADAGPTGSTTADASTAASTTSPAAASTTGPAGTTVTSTVTSTAAQTVTGTKTTAGTTTTAPTAPSATKGATAAATTTSAPPKTTATTTAAPKTTAPPPPSYNAQGQLICADRSIRVEAITQGGPTFPAGSQPRLGMAVTNTGTATCVRDLSGPLQVYTVYTASGQRVWSTADCFPGTGQDVRSLGPGKSATFIIVWAGTNSSPGCTAKRSPVPAGKYTVVAQLGKLTSAPTPFTMR